MLFHASVEIIATADLPRIVGMRRDAHTAIGVVQSAALIPIVDMRGDGSCPHRGEPEWMRAVSCVWSNCSCRHRKRRHRVDYPHGYCARRSYPVEGEPEWIASRQLRVEQWLHTPADGPIHSGSPRWGHEHRPAYPRLGNQAADLNHPMKRYERHAAYQRCRASGGGNNFDAGHEHITPLADRRRSSRQFRSRRFKGAHR